MTQEQPSPGGHDWRRAVSDWFSNYEEAGSRGRRAGVDRLTFATVAVFVVVFSGGLGLGLPHGTSTSPLVLAFVVACGLVFGLGAMAAWARMPSLDRDPRVQAYPSPRQQVAIFVIGTVTYTLGSMAVMGYLT